MDTEHYDEFGNYTGPLIDSDEESSDDSNEEIEDQDNLDDDDDDLDEQDENPDTNEDSNNMEVVLHEEKKYYPTSSELYGKEVEVLVHEEDELPLTQPIIEPTKANAAGEEKRKPPPTVYDVEFLKSLMETPDRIRNIAIAGNLHCGKTNFVDCLVEQTHLDIKAEEDRDLKYTDSLKLEFERGLSVKSTPITFLLPDVRDKSYAVNVIDTPGHINFIDEVVASLRLSDGVVLLVDVHEGVTLNTEKIIKQAIKDQLQITLVINKIDRLILELRLPPNDAYSKLKYIIDSVNSVINKYTDSTPFLQTDGYNYQQKRLSPTLGNVCFASSYYRFCFSLYSFAKIYEAEFPGVHAKNLSKFLWGDFYYNSIEGKFQKNPQGHEPKRSFIEFILEPLYKIFSTIVGDVDDQLESLCSELGVFISRSESKMNIRPLLRLVLSRYFGNQFSGFVSMIGEFIPSPLDNARVKVINSYTGALDDELAESMYKCDSTSKNLMVHVTKLYPRPDAVNFYSLGRIMCGSLHQNQQVRVLGELYSLDDEEDSRLAVTGRIFISCARYKIELDKAVAGSLVMMEGVDQSIMKTATITDTQYKSTAMVFRKLNFNTCSVLKIAVEPANPSELPKMMDGMRKVNKSYPLLVTRSEPNGENIILGTGELYFDCVMHDLRKIYSDIQIKVADPVVSFCETVVETSSLRCFAETPNKRNRLTMICEPLQPGIAEDIEDKKINLNWPKKRIGEFFQSKYSWDLLASRSIWAFGPSENGPNILLDDTLPSEVDKNLLSAVKNLIIQGFQWGVREGPLCDEPIRNMKFKILDAQIDPESRLRPDGNIISTTRRAVHSAFLMATPRLMEPILTVEIQSSADCIAAIYSVISKRRGHVIKDSPICGSPLYSMTAFVPAIDSFGLETDIRTHTQGQAFCQSTFDHWNQVPGDPMDRSIKLKPLVQQEINDLAREFMVKTRRRKGLNEDVSIHKFFDDPMLLEMANQNMAHIL